MKFKRVLLASQLVVERVNPDVVLGVRSEVGELAFDGVAREDGAILSVLSLVREEHLVAVVFLPRRLDRIELGAAIIGIPYRRTPLKQRTPRLDIGHLERGIMRLKTLALPPLSLPTALRLRTTTSQLPSAF